jgi:hypothetical protein
MQSWLMAKPILHALHPDNLVLPAYLLMLCQPHRILWLPESLLLDVKRYAYGPLQGGMPGLAAISHANTIATPAAHPALRAIPATCFPLVYMLDVVQAWPPSQAQSWQSATAGTMWCAPTACMVARLRS